MKFARRAFVYVAKWTLRGVIVGVLAGLSSAALLASLKWATEIRIDTPWLLWLLPLAGLGLGSLYHYYGQTSRKGNALIVDEIHAPEAWIPRRMAPFVFFGTVVTQLFGGSAGREGTALQMSGSLTDAVGRLLKVSAEDRRIMLITSLAGGFGAVFGVPAAGFVFALEVQRIGRLRKVALYPAIIASVLGHTIVLATGLEHEIFPRIAPSSTSILLVLKLVAVGLLFGLTARVFTTLTHFVSSQLGNRKVPVPWRPFIGGVAVVALTYAVGNRSYNGLSLPLIAEAFAGGAAIIGAAFALKLLFTSVTLGSGFIGGEVTPLFVIGATLGVSLGRLFDVDTQMLAGLGFVSVFAGAANVPLTGMVMGAELFGIDALWLFVITCGFAFATSAHNGIYYSERHSRRKEAKSPPQGPM